MTTGPEDQGEKLSFQSNCQSTLIQEGAQERREGAEYGGGNGGIWVRRKDQGRSGGMDNDPAEDRFTPTSQLIVSRCG